MIRKNVYFLHCPLTNRVKIGSAFDVDRRKSILQTGSPTKLDLIGQIEADDPTERLLHRMLQSWHTHGEWFEYSAPVRAFIGSLISLNRAEPTEETGDTFDRFILECVKPGDSASGVAARAMYIAYAAWCAADGTAAASETMFGRRMKTKLVRDDTRRVHTYVGVSLRELAEVAA